MRIFVHVKGSVSALIMDHKKVLKSSASVHSTNSVQQTTLGNGSGGQDIHERVSEIVGGGLGVGNLGQGALAIGSFLSHVLCEEHSDQSVVNTTTICSGHIPLSVYQPIMHVAGGS